MPKKNDLQQYNCEGCGGPAKFSILIATTPDEEGGERYYLPNQFARTAPAYSCREMMFCRNCIRVMDEGFRIALRDVRAGKVRTDA